ncbi:replicative DNA helicase [Apibacter raozihei]|uniref:replicative DNA helicase n=1 Tax=Apibacter TaxID=1778601 RepID=UPI000FE3A169|nr:MULTISPECIES: replicative DNA helicase [Apibacter]
MEQLESKSNNFTKSNKIITLEKGKLPPQAVELEEAVLGAMMIDKKGLDEIIDILSPEVFYKKEHQFIYEAIEDLFKETEPIDILTISNKLRSQGKLEAAGGDFNLIQLSNKVSSSAHIEYHSRIILEKYILRKLIEISSNMIEKSYDETSDVFDLLDYSESQLYEITNGTLKRTFNEAKNLVSNALKKIKSLESKQGMSGIPSGFKHVDKITAGWQPSDLIIIAARPGMGKTAFILSMARNIAISSEVPIGIFSLEMSAEQLMMRMISSETGIESEKLRKANLSELEWQQLYSRVNKLEKAPIFIDDSPGISVFDLRAKARRLVSQHGVRIIMIDYLQLMSAGGKGIGNREQEIATISRSLKAIAKELEIPVIALSQLSRSVETRGGSKKPLLSDLRESGAIEQDADIVTFIYRPEYYKLETWEDGTPCSGQGEFIIAKHRNGALEDVRLKFTSSQAKFSDLDDNFYSGGDQGNDISTTFESRINDESSFESAINLPSINPSDSFGIDDNINDQDADMPF